MLVWGSNLAGYKVEGDHVAVWSPYDPETVRALKQMGGQWDPVRKVWVVPARRSDKVQTLLKQRFGLNEDGTITWRTVRVDLDAIADSTGTLEAPEWRVRGFTVIRKIHRDVTPRVVAPNGGVVQGAFKELGGSRNYPYITWEPGTVIEFDVPAPLAEDLVASGVGQIVDRPAGPAVDPVEDAVRFIMDRILGEMDRDRRRAVMDRLVELTGWVRP